jgi:hypothetical protein
MSLHCHLPRPNRIFDTIDDADAGDLITCFKFLLRFGGELQLDINSNLTLESLTQAMIHAKLSALIDAIHSTLLINIVDGCPVAVSGKEEEKRFKTMRVGVRKMLEEDERWQEALEWLLDVEYFGRQFKLPESIFVNVLGQKVLKSWENWPIRARLCMLRELCDHAMDSKAVVEDLLEVMGSREELNKETQKEVKKEQLRLNRKIEEVEKELKLFRDEHFEGGGDDDDDDDGEDGSEEGEEEGKSEEDKDEDGDSAGDRESVRASQIYSGEARLLRKLQGLKHERRAETERLEEALGVILENGECVGSVW